MDVRRNTTFKQQLLHVQLEVYGSSFTSLNQELQDNLGQLLSTARILLRLAERELDQVPDTLMTAGQTLGTAINELRSLSKFLLMTTLESFDLAANLEKEMSWVRSLGMMRTQVSGVITIPLPADVQMILFRVMQQAILNAVRHSSAGCLFVGMQLSEEELILIVRDDGIGFNTLQTKGAGLESMRRRIAILGGRIDWNCSAGAGTEVIIHLSIQNTAL